MLADVGVAGAGMGDSTLFVNLCELQPRRSPAKRLPQGCGLVPPQRAITSFHYITTAPHHLQELANLLWAFSKLTEWPSWQRCGVLLLRALGAVEARAPEFLPEELAALLQAQASMGFFHPGALAGALACAAPFKSMLAVSGVTLCPN